MNRREVLKSLLLAPLAFLIPEFVDDLFDIEPKDIEIPGTDTPWGPFRYAILYNADTDTPIAFWDYADLSKSLKNGDSFVLPNPVEIKVSLE